MLESLAAQLVNGLASASTLFLIAAGLSLIFGVTRIVNFAHGSFFMIGLYLAWTVTDRLGSGPLGFWGAIVLAALGVGALGALLEILVLRRVYRAPELLQLLATFAVVLMLRDAALAIWGPEDLLGPKAPGLRGTIPILGRPIPTYDLVLVAIGPVVLGLLWLLLYRTRLGMLIRAATQDREMVGALGVDQRWLFTGVFALGAALAGLGGALQLPREPAHLGLDLATIGEAFVVVVVGGMGSIPGAYLAALLIAEVKALCHGLGTLELAGLTVSFSRLTLVVEFLVMAAVLIVRPWGLLGRPAGAVRVQGPAEPPLQPAGARGRAVAWVLFVAVMTAPLWAGTDAYALVLLIDIAVAVLFAASLHFIMGPGGMHSFGHAAYFGIGAYAAALLARDAALPMGAVLVLAPVAAGLAAVVFGWFAVRLSGVYLAMLTLAFAQIVWSVVFQWDTVTGGSNGLVGIRPAAAFESRAAFLALAVLLVTGGVLLLRRLLFSPFGWAMRAGRDSPLRAEAVGIDVVGIHWAAFAVAGCFGGLAGALYALAKGTISPEAIAVGRSVDGLVMVLLGGVQSLAGPLAGAALFTWLQDAVVRGTDYWRAMLGAVILLLVLAFPQGIAGAGGVLAARLRGRASP
jgi:branched-chain amino acid transport system permease protein